MTNELDLKGLDEIFSNDEQNNNEIDEKKIDFNTNIDYTNAIDALKKNIYNANQLLEKIQNEMNKGNFSARLAEVTGTIINSITQASKEILSDENYNEYMDVRKALVLLKEKEIDIKRQKITKQPLGQTNVLIATREDILKSIEEKKLKQIGKEIKNELLSN